MRTKFADMLPGLWKSSHPLGEHAHATCRVARLAYGRGADRVVARRDGGHLRSPGVGLSAAAMCAATDRFLLWPVVRRGSRRPHQDRSADGLPSIPQEVAARPPGVGRHHDPPLVAPRSAGLFITSSGILTAFAVVFQLIRRAAVGCPCMPRPSDAERGRLAAVSSATFSPGRFATKCSRRGLEGARRGRISPRVAPDGARAIKSVLAHPPARGDEAAPSVGADNSVNSSGARRPRSVRSGICDRRVAPRPLLPWPPPLRPGPGPLISRSVGRPCSSTRAPPDVAPWGDRCTPPRYPRRPSVGQERTRTPFGFEACVPVPSGLHDPLRLCALMNCWCRRLPVGASGSPRTVLADHQERDTRVFPLAPLLAVAARSPPPGCNPRGF